MLVATMACTAANRTTSYSMRASGAPRSVFASVADAASVHHRIARVDPDRAVVVTEPELIASAKVLYVIQLGLPETFPAGCFKRHCPSPRYRLAITPVAFEDGHELAYAEIPRPARDRVDDLMWDIRERLIERRFVY